MDEYAGSIPAASMKMRFAGLFREALGNDSLVIPAFRCHI
jgi:hypothetical protein